MRPFSLVSVTGLQHFLNLNQSILMRKHVSRLDEIKRRKISHLAGAKIILYKDLRNEDRGKPG